MRMFSGVAAGAAKIVQNENRNRFLSAPTSLSADEGATASVVVTSTRAFKTNTELHFAIVPLGGAVAGIDYSAPASPLILVAGQLTATLAVDLLTDEVADPGESFRVDWLSVVPP